MSDEFDPYREALVIETLSTWPENCHLKRQEKEKIAAAIHADPENASNISYTRMHTGFRRDIAITDEDIARARG